MIDIREVITIGTVAASGSFRLAAERMNATQPTLSRIVGKVEAELGRKLFQRGWAGTEPTATGDIISRFAALVKTELAIAESRLFGEDRPHPALESNISFLQLQLIDTVRRCGSTTLAAQELGRGQPSVSRILGDFRAYFGLELFRRERRGLVALAEVDHLATLYSRLSAILAEMHDHLRREEGQLTGRVAIGMLPFSGQALVPRVFAALGTRHPGLRLVCVPGTYAGLVEALRRREIEGILGVLRGDECPDDLSELPLLDETFTIVARRGHPALARAQTLGDLAGESWIVPPHGSPVRAYFETVFNEIGARPRVQTCEMLFFAASEQLVATSDFLGMQSYSRSGLAMLSPDLSLVKVPLPACTARVGLTTLHGQPDPPGFGAFRDLAQSMAVEFN